jgi:starch synthase
MTKVLFVASEAAPFAKTGGLGDVIASLPKELRKQGADVRVIMPKYLDIPPGYQQTMTKKVDFIVPVGWREQYCGIEELEFQGVTFYFVDNEYYFKRHGYYGHMDDAERFSFFDRAVLEALPKIDFIPDVLHCHDWHAGMTAVLLEAHYREIPEYANIRTLFTVHNLRYQGVFPKEILGDLLDLDWKYFVPDGLEFFDSVNFMKAGLAFADVISTVSRTYADEIQHPYFGEQLDGLLRNRSERLTGIVNGIDYDFYNPATDSAIFHTYDVNSLEQKAQNKMKLQQRLGLPVNENAPLISIVSRLVGPKGMDLIERVLVDLIQNVLIENPEYQETQIVVLGTGEARYENLFRYAAWQYPMKVSANILFDDALAHQIYAGADMFLMPSLYEPCGIGQLIAMRYGCLPVVRETGGLKDTVIPYNKDAGDGTGFTFANYNAHEMMGTLQTALEVYQDKEIWNGLVRNAMTSDFSWRESARCYLELYEKLKNIEK